MKQRSIIVLPFNPWGKSLLLHLQMLHCTFALNCLEMEYGVEYLPFFCKRDFAFLDAAVYYVVYFLFSQSSPKTHVAIFITVAWRFLVQCHLGTQRSQTFSSGFHPWPLRTEISPESLNLFTILCDVDGKLFEPRGAVQWQLDLHILKAVSENFSFRWLRVFTRRKKVLNKMKTLTWSDITSGYAIICHEKYEES